MQSNLLFCVIFYVELLRFWYSSYIFRLFLKCYLSYKNVIIYKYIYIRYFYNILIQLSMFAVQVYILLCAYICIPVWNSCNSLTFSRRVSISGGIICIITVGQHLETLPPFTACKTNAFRDQIQRQLSFYVPFSSLIIEFISEILEL